MERKFYCPKCCEVTIIKNTNCSSTKCLTCGKILTESNELNPQPKPEQNIPRCPTCGCTNIKKLDSLDRGLSVFAWGLASSKIGKQFECLNPKCKYKW